MSPLADPPNERREHFKIYGSNTAATGGAATESWQSFIPKHPPRGQRAIIWCHGAGSDYTPGPAERSLAERFGYPLICCDLGGQRTWGSDTSLDRIDQAWAWAISTYGVATDKYLLWGGSMGGLTSGLKLIADSAHVAAWGSAIAAMDPEFVRNKHTTTTTGTNTLGGTNFTVTVVSTTGFPSFGTFTVPNNVIVYTGKTATSFTGCSYGSGTVSAGAAVVQGDPNASDLNKSAIEGEYGAGTVPSNKQLYTLGASVAATGVPAKLWYSDNDQFTPPQSYQTFLAAATNVEGVSLGAVTHGYNALNDGDGQAAFFDPYRWEGT